MLNYISLVSFVSILFNLILLFVSAEHFKFSNYSYNYINIKEYTLIFDSSFIYKIKIHNKKILWKNNIKNNLRCINNREINIFYLKNKIYLFYNSLNILCISFNSGNIIWKKNTFFSIIRNITYKDNIFYILNSKKQIYLINSFNGKLLLFINKKYYKSDIDYHNYILNNNIILKSCHHIIFYNKYNGRVNVSIVYNNYIPSFLVNQNYLYTLVNKTFVTKYNLIFFFTNWKKKIYFYNKLSCNYKI